MTDTPVEVEFNELVKITNTFESALKQYSEKSRGVFLKQSTNALVRLEQKEKMLKTLFDDIERAKTRMSEDQDQIKEEILSIEDWKVYEKAKVERKLTEGSWVVVCAPNILAVEMDKKKALEKLTTAGRKCLLVQVGDEHHVYHLNEVTCRYNDLAYYCPGKVNASGVEFKVDTGAQLCTLSQTVVDTLSLKATHEITCSSAFGNPRKVNAFTVTLTIDNKANPFTECVVSAAYPLLGMSVLVGYAISMVNGTQMKITAL